MTHDSTTATAFTAFDFLCPVRAELTAEIKAGKDIDGLAAELAAEESSGDLTETEIATALRALRADDYKAAAETGTEDGIEHADDLASGSTGEGASAETLRACAAPGNDWGTSSSEAWSLIGGAERFGVDAYPHYCVAYEGAARARCDELADETKRETPEAIADRVGREWGEEMVGQRCYPDGIDDEAQAARDLENCAFDVLRDEMRAAGYADPTERDDWRSLVSASCRAAVACVVELMADDAEDEDDGQPSELQENEDFAHDNDF